MILGSHNSWSYLPTKKWWMKPISFTARCQCKTIREQYELGARCFDLRVRYKKNGSFLIVAHGVVEYDTGFFDINDDLDFLERNKDCYVRVINEVRRKSQYTEPEKTMFRKYCEYLQWRHPDIKFWCGRNLYDWMVDYDFGNYPTCEEKYASVCPPRILDDWFPLLYAKFHNRKIREQETDSDILLIDYIDIK